MNLQGITAGAVGAVNPNIRILHWRSQGSVIEASGERTPIYARPKGVWAQWQEVTQDDLRRADALNLQGVKAKLFFTGEAAGAVRPDDKGGDLFTKADGTVWLVQSVLQGFDGWVSLLVVRQNP